MIVEPSAPVEVNEPAPVLEDSNNVARATQEALEAEWLNERYLDYQKGEKQAANSQKKGQEKDMVASPGTPIDDFINAHLHVRCRRKIVNLYFGNDTNRRKGEPIITSDGTASHTCHFCNSQS